MLRNQRRSLELRPPPPPKQQKLTLWQRRTRLSRPSLSIEPAEIRDRLYSCLDPASGSSPPGLLYRTEFLRAHTCADRQIASPSNRRSCSTPSVRESER